MKKITMFLCLLLITGLMGYGQARQCLGVTKDNVRCKNITKNASGYCYLHQSQFKTPPPPSIWECGEEITDSRDGNKYPTVQIGAQCWFQTNLNYGTMVTETQSDNAIAEKYCYNDDETYCNESGGMYDWKEVMNYNLVEGSKGICPEGWHVPSGDDIETLFTVCGGQAHAGPAMKQIYSWEHPRVTNCPQPTNESGFTGMPGGTRWSTGEYKYLTSSGLWWTSVEKPEYGSAFYFGIGWGMETAKFGQLYYGQAVQLRCVQD